MFAAKIHRHPTQRAAADAAGGGGGNYAGLVKPVLTVTAAGDDATRGMDGETSDDEISGSRCVIRRSERY